MGSNQSSYAATVARGYDQDGSNWNRNPNTDGYGSHFGKGPKNDQRSKERNQERVSDMLHDDHDLDASDIDVSTDDSGEVTLSGTVSSRMDKRRAEDCAYRVRSVRHVQNNITISDNDGDNISARSSGGPGRASPPALKLERPSVPNWDRGLFLILRRLVRSPSRIAHVHVLRKADRT